MFAITAASVFLRLSNFVKVLEHNLHQTLTKRRFLLCLPQTGKDVSSLGIHLSQLVVPVCSPHQTCPKVSKPWAIRRRFRFQFRSLQVPGSNQNQLSVTVANQFTAKNISFPPPTAAWRIFCSWLLSTFLSQGEESTTRLAMCWHRSNSHLNSSWDENVSHMFQNHFIRVRWDLLSLRVPFGYQATSRVRDPLKTNFFYHNIIIHIKHKTICSKSAHN